MSTATCEPMTASEPAAPAPVTSAPPVSVAAVVVTFNRLELLKECVAALRAQTRRPDEIIVVNNGSSDGTVEWLAAQPDLTVITQENSGSAGGQYTGIKAAYLNGHDWFWCMDDDTIPQPQALEALTESRPFGEATTGFLFSVTLDAAGKVDGFLPTTASHDWWGTVVTDHCVRVDLATFVSVMYARRAVAELGLPLRWLFIWGEDFEFSRRVAGHFKGWVVLDSKVIHQCASKPTIADPFSDPKFRTRMLYYYRNEIVRARIDPLTGRFERMGSMLNTFYRCARLMVRRKLPLKTLVWLAEGLVRTIRFEFPEGR